MRTHCGVPGKGSNHNFSSNGGGGDQRRGQEANGEKLTTSTKVMREHLKNVAFNRLATEQAQNSNEFIK